MRRLALLSLVAASGCRSVAKSELSGGLSGVALPQAVARPSFVLTTTTGDTFDFRDRTRGRLTLLFFGYTHCPDVCPATMQNIAAVTNRLTALERQQLDVVFVTTDPDRDTAAALGPWLAQFDKAFIGLTGPITAVEAAQRAAGVSVAIRPAGRSDYQVSHAAQVLVYSADDSGHVAYPFGTRQAEWAADLPKLAERWRGR